MVFVYKKLAQFAVWGALPPRRSESPVCAADNKPSCVLHLLGWFIGSCGFSSLERRPEFWVLQKQGGPPSGMPERNLQELEAEAVHTGSSFRRWAFKVIGSDKVVATARSQVFRLPEFVTGTVTWRRLPLEGRPSTPPFYRDDYPRTGEEATGGALQT